MELLYTRSSFLHFLFSILFPKIFQGKQVYRMFQLDKWERGCNISNVVGGVAGIGGGAAVIGGVILMPPVAVAGLAVGGVAAASNMATGLFKLHNLKKNVLAAKEMLEYDRRMTETLANSIASLEETKESILSSNNIEMRAKCTTSKLNRETVISSGRVGAVSLAGGAVRLVLKESATLPTAMAKGAVHALTAVGIAIDLLTVTLSVKVSEGSPLLSFLFSFSITFLPISMSSQY
ncbi:unnamed protein product [Haemonchus placei]|uniref:Apolipoprotein L3-like n=1 Tax=Haemonchus placei TaxID=6290 RepID=A0A0N4WY74_HAEPC|nr:unnamed protein product [Haemonchus placei]